MRFFGFHAISQIFETCDFFKEFAIAAFIVLLLSAIGFDFGKIFGAGKEKAVKQAVPAPTISEKSWHGSEHN